VEGRAQRFACGRAAGHVGTSRIWKKPLADRAPRADVATAAFPTPADAARSDAAPADAAAADVALVARAAAGDVDALGALYDRHGAAAYALARVVVRAADDAEDVVAQVFAQLWREAARYDAGRGSVAAWVTMLTRSRALDLVRARRRRAGAEERAAASAVALGEGDAVGTALPLGGRADPPDLVLERGEASRAVRASLAVLPEPQRHAVVLAFFGGLSHGEVAATLGIPLGTAKTRIRAGLHRLRDVLRPHAPGVEG